MEIAVGVTKKIYNYNPKNVAVAVMESILCMPKVLADLITTYNDFGEHTALYEGILDFVDRSDVLRKMIEGKILHTRVCKIYGIPNVRNAIRAFDKSHCTIRHCYIDPENGLGSIVELCGRAPPIIHNARDGKNEDMPVSANFNGSFIVNSIFLGEYGGSLFHRTYFYGCHIMMTRADLSGAIFYNCIFDDGIVNLIMHSAVIYCADVETKKWAIKFRPKHPDWIWKNRVRIAVI